MNATCEDYRIVRSPTNAAASTLVASCYRFLKASGLGTYGEALRGGADLYQRRRDVGASEEEVQERIRAAHPAVGGNASEVPDATMSVWATVHHGCHAHKTSDHPGKREERERNE